MFWKNSNFGAAAPACRALTVFLLLSQTLDIDARELQFHSLEELEVAALNVGQLSAGPLLLTDGTTPQNETFGSSSTTESADIDVNVLPARKRRRGKQQGNAPGSRASFNWQVLQLLMQSCDIFADSLELLRLSI